MSAVFDFAIRKVDLSRINALRDRLNADLWPAAAFEIFRSAYEASLAGSAVVPIHPSICFAAILARKSRGYVRLIPSAVRVRQYAADPLIVAFLRDVARHYGLPDAKTAATALVAAWAVDPKCWPGAPAVGGDA